MKYLKNKKHTIITNLVKFNFAFVLVFALAVPVFMLNTTNTFAVTKSISVSTKIENPLGKDLTDIPSFIKKIIEIVLMIGIPVLVLAIIYTGFLFVQAQGNPTKLTDAKKALASVLIGGALLLGAFVIAEAIGTTVEEIKNNV